MVVHGSRRLLAKSGRDLAEPTFDSAAGIIVVSFRFFFPDLPQESQRCATLSAAMPGRTARDPIVSRDLNFP
jgi:hypothetical protein